MRGFVLLWHYREIWQRDQRLVIYDKPYRCYKFEHISVLPLSDPISGIFGSPLGTVNQYTQNVRSVSGVVEARRSES